jgi:hypothetical protein
VPLKSAVDVVVLLLKGELVEPFVCVVTFRTWYVKSFWSAWQDVAEAKSATSRQIKVYLNFFIGVLVSLGPLMRDVEVTG